MPELIIPKQKLIIRRRISRVGYKTIDHIRSEFSKLAQKEYKSKHDWLEKVIDRKLCKKLKFNHTDKWYLHKPDSILEYEMHKNL